VSVKIAALANTMLPVVLMVHAMPVVLGGTMHWLLPQHASIAVQESTTIKVLQKNVKVAVLEHTMM
jgi:hypothetical protein